MSACRLRKTNPAPLLTAVQDAIRVQWPSLRHSEVTLLARTQLMGILLSCHKDDKIRAAGEDLRGSVHECLCTGINHKILTAWTDKLESQLRIVISKIQSPK